MAGNAKIFFCCFAYLLVASAIAAWFATEMNIPGVSGALTPAIPISTGIGFIDGVFLTANILSNMLTIIVWTLPENVFPLVLNIIFIKTALVGCIIGFLSVVLP